MSRTTSIRRGPAAPALACIVSMLAMTACAAPGDDPGDGQLGGTTTTEELGEPQPGGELVVGLEAESDGYLPGRTAFTPSATNVMYALFDPLLARTADGTLRPFLARSFTANADVTEWTVSLRPGVSFHDGSRLDGHALKAVFDEFLTAPGATTAGALEQVRELRVDDELTVTYVLHEPNAGFPDLLTEAAGMPFSVEAARAAGGDLAARPSGTGPFQLESWVPEDRLVLTRNPAYWREGLPYLDRLTFRPIADESMRFQALLTGVVDAMQSMRGSTIKAVLASEDEGLRAHTTAGDDAGISVMNTLQPPFDDVRIRRAYAHTVDQDWIADILGDDGLVEPATQFFSQDSPWYSERVAAARPTFDIDRATRLVEEYVNDPARSDGKSVGEPPTLRYGCLDEPSLLELSQLVKLSAGQAGFDVELVHADQATHVAATTGRPDSDPPYRGDFMVNCYRAVPHGSPYATLSAWFGPPATTPSNLSNFHDDHLAGLLERLASAREFDEQHRLVEQIGIHINEHAPNSYGTATPAMVGVRADVKNAAGWTLPDGEPGNGIGRATARWGEVWVED